MVTPARCYNPSARPYTGTRQAANHNKCERVGKVKNRGMVHWSVMGQIAEGWQIAGFHDYPVALLNTRQGQFHENPKMMRAAEGIPRGGSPLPPPNRADSARPGVTHVTA